MRTHIMGLTYGPKIDAVFNDECHRTTRLVQSDVPWNVGDKLIMHTWTGRPYRSPWGRRLDTEVVDLRYIYCKDGVGWFQSSQPSRNGGAQLTEGDMDGLALLDGIAPPTGSAYISTLMALNALTREQLHYATFRIVIWPMRR